MIIRDGSDQKIERMKYKLGLTGDVYLVGQNYIESLESHRRLIPGSTAETIEEAEQERLSFIAAEEEARAKAEAEAKAKTEEETEEGISVDKLDESHEA